ncbi:MULTISPECIES: type II toxin-antitoxin system RelE/ParE family toxin [unclassified Pseudoxanthomonas]|uniref:type II toxin-antitoxin system RelE/ParE family toxin n=1 Tax=unclassified Pseudoxanthomonas TaxID=2645906 RepID=UPI001613832B|nr:MULTISPECIES: type II toxin-antitoxin system RelE/ParE family toxin [unclassified Pseudoxanthomonas]MBB3274282.1 phage-related protein [Pseudoxanthomonas sp. OG2]MBV7474790.1 type II toxin-antitoxin system RelE/ParE family toxin [Pseudoxanthomonas sp. PXM05]
MRLRLLTSGQWQVAALIDDRDRCEVLEALNALAANKQTEATAAGFRVWWEQIPAEGPRQLSDAVYHRVDAKNEIYEFCKRAHRVLCFEAGGRLIVCSHVMPKGTQKTPKKEVERAVKLKKEYERALVNGGVEIVEDDE